MLEALMRLAKVEEEKRRPKIETIPAANTQEERIAALQKRLAGIQARQVAQTVVSRTPQVVRESLPKEERIG